MNKDKFNQLANILEKLNNGENSEKVKFEARDFLATISPTDLSIAEQRLIDNGLEPSALRHLCSAHMSMLEGSLGSIKESLAPKHVIRAMITEHDILLKLLNELEKINKVVTDDKGVVISLEIINKLNDLAKNLIGAEPHHQREENILFPALEAAGVSGPPRIMKMEHVELRELKKRLLGLSEIGSDLSVEDFKKELQIIAESLIFKLRDHIFKENNILYPTALKVINTEKEWADLKRGCDDIGYCDFTPTENI